MATRRAMGDTPLEINIRHICDCMKIDPTYGKGVDIPLSDILDALKASEKTLETTDLKIPLK